MRALEISLLMLIDVVMLFTQQYCSHTSRRLGGGVLHIDMISVRKC